MNKLDVSTLYPSYCKYLGEQMIHFPKSGVVKKLEKIT
jgi:hypothetical protein